MHPVVNMAERFAEEKQAAKARHNRIEQFVDHLFNHGKIKHRKIGGLTQKEMVESVERVYSGSFNPIGIGH